MKQVMRDYQIQAIQDLRDTYASGIRSAALVLPTGGGKTTVAANIIDSAVAHGNRIAFLAHRKELIDQCSARLDEHGIDHGIIKAGNRRVNSQPVQVASVQTLVRRVKPKQDGEELISYRQHFDIFIIDECHRALAKSYRDILDYWPEAVILGLTATPVRADGQGMGDLFESLVPASSPAELTEMGFLVPARVFTTPLTPSFDKVKHKGGEFDQNAVEAMLDKGQIIGDIYKHWSEIAPERQTVVFAVSRKHAMDICDEFVRQGVKAEYLDGETEESVREAILARVKSRETRVIVNVGILTEGWDNPEISCVILARPTESVGLYLQMAGRALRPAPWIGKVDCIIIDHGGNTARHGFVSDEREWSLEGSKKRKATDNIKPVMTCRECFALYSGPACPECGTMPDRKQTARPGTPEEINGRLVEQNPALVRSAEKMFFEDCLQKQEMYGYRPSYAIMKFKDQFGHWPGKEIGLKKKWGMEKTENGKKHFLAGYEYQGRFIPIRERDPDGNPTASWNGSPSPAMAGEYW